MKHSFKVGDKVVRVKQAGKQLSHGAVITIGKEYEVLEVHPDGTYIKIRNDAGRLFIYASKMFELAKV